MFRGNSVRINSNNAFNRGIPLAGSGKSQLMPLRRRSGLVDAGRALDNHAIVNAPFSDS